MHLFLIYFFYIKFINLTFLEWYEENPVGAYEKILLIELDKYAVYNDAV